MLAVGEEQRDGVRVEVAELDACRPSTPGSGSALIGSGFS
jgi:hypothetical protein